MMHLPNFHLNPDVLSTLLTLFYWTILMVIASALISS
jgi:hypothetical protein